MQKHFNVAIGAAILGLVSSCGSGGSSAAAVPLTVPAQLSIVDANSATLSAGIKRALIAGSDYATDTTQLWIHDESMEAMELVNVILCSIGQCGVSDASVLNKGAYTALVACEEGRGDVSAAGAQEFQIFTVKSERASGSAPHIVSFWFDSSNDNVNTRLYGKLTITEGTSTAKPFGAFTLSWKELLATDSPTATPRSTGSLKTVPRNDGKVEFALFNSEGDADSPVAVNERAYRMRARVVSNSTFTAGQAYTEQKNAQNTGSGTVYQSSEYFIQFNTRYFARKKVSGGSTIQVYDRNDFDTFGFRYGLYHETAQNRATNNGGFPIETASGNRGWVGYHGLWFGTGVTITNGQELTRRSYQSGGSDTSYFAFIAPGRLEKRTSSDSTMGNLKDEEFITWDSVNSTEMKVAFDGTNFNKVATFDMNTGQWTTVSPVSVAGQYSTNDFVSMRNNARGDVQFVWPGGGPISGTVAKLWKRSIINGDSDDVSAGNLTLYGYFNMLKTNITNNQANYISNETPYFADATNVGQGKAYVFDKTTLTLKHSSQNVALANGVELTGGPRQGGLDCGPLVATALTSLSDMGTQTTTYTWFTGSNTYNQYRTVKDGAGNFVNFSAPLRFSYTHIESGNAFNGKTFTLQLEGDELHGVPFAEFGNTGRWYPGFNIPNGTVLIDEQGGRYLVKMLEGEQKMKTVVNPNTIITQEGFDLDSNLTPPSSAYADPAIGAVPTVTDPPRFVEGEKQG